MVTMLYSWQVLLGERLFEVFVILHKSYVQSDALAITFITCARQESFGSKTMPKYL